MSKRTIKKGFDESSRKTRVKLYKSGKQWVQCLMTRLGLLRLSTTVQADEQALNSQSNQTEVLLKGVLAAGALLGGGAVGTTGALAATDVPVAQTNTTATAGEQLADQTTVTMPSNSQTSLSASTAQTSTSHEQQSTSASLAQQSQAESASLSISQSQSTSASESALQHQSTSNSLNPSTSESDRTARTTQTSQGSADQSGSTTDQSVATSMTAAQAAFDQVLARAQSLQQTPQFQSADSQLQLAVTALAKQKRPANFLRKTMPPALNNWRC